MLTFSRNIFKLLFLMAFLFGFTACEVPTDAQQDINDQLTPPPADNSDDDDTVGSSLCETETFKQPPLEFTKKLDLLFVVDTSSSLYDELPSIVDGIDGFIDALPVDIDLQMAVLLAHGDNSPHSGKIYAKTGNQKVIKSVELTRADLKTQLIGNMYKAPTDDTDGGEVGLYSLNKAITVNLDYNKGLGFFRDFSALAIVFVADENDICSMNRYPGVIPVYDPNKSEPKAFDKYCNDLTPSDVATQLSQLQTQQGQPLLVSGIIYTDPGTVPSGGENEVGYGYLDVILAHSGVTVDLASGNYTSGLSNIGSMAASKLNLKTEFTLKLSNFNENTLEVYVDQQPVDFTYKPDLNEVHIPVEQAGGANSEVYITYCQPLVPLVQFFAIDVVSVSTAINVSWQTDLPALGFIEITESLTGVKDVIPEGTGYNTSHNQVITGLKPNTLYTIRILGENTDGAMSGTDPFNVRTQP